MGGSSGDRAVIPTALGDLVFDLVDPRDRPSRAPHSIQVFPITPRLTAGMTVRSAVAVLLTVTPRVTMTRLRFRCCWAIAPAAESGIESGECLDSQAWEGDGHIVHVGTEDIETLETRLPDCRFDRAPPPRCTDHPTYVRDGMNVTVPYLKAGATVTLHYIVADNPLPQPVEESTWYAVDLDHDLVVAQRP